MFFIRSYGRVASLLILGMALLFLDFLTKAYVFQLLHFCSGTPSSLGVGAFPVFYNFLGIDFLINLAVNKGAAWGLFANFQIPLLLLRIGVICGIVVYLFFLNHNPALTLPLVLITAGAIGNVIDFFLYGYVVDFMHFNLWGYNFPIFNFADVCITIGVIWMSLLLFAQKKQA